MDEIESNENGGHCVNGRAFDMTQKSTVIRVYTDLYDNNPTKLPSVRHAAKGAQVSTGYTCKVMREYYGNDAIEDPHEAAKRLAKERENIQKLELRSLSFCSHFGWRTYLTGVGFGSPILPSTVSSRIDSTLLIWKEEISRADFKINLS